jgi:hypothetical protein
MKKYTLLLSVLFLLFSCRKDKAAIAPVIEPAISKVFENNILTAEYFYSPSKKLDRINYYDDDGLFQFAFLYSYNTDGNVVLKKQVDIQNKATYQTVYTWQTKDILTKVEEMPLFGSDSAKITTRLKYTYDLNGRIGKRVWLDPTTDKPLGSQEFYYYENGDLKSTEWYDNPALPKLKAKYLYTRSALAAPQNLLKFNAEPIDLGLLIYNIEEVRHFFYDDAGITTTEFTTVRTGTNRNSNGLIISQLKTTKYQKPVKPALEMKIRYEYTEL